MMDFFMLPLIKIVFCLKRKKTSRFFMNQLLINNVKIYHFNYHYKNLLFDAKKMYFLFPKEFYIL